MSNKAGGNKEANIRAYYGEVSKFGQNGEYDKAIKSLNKSKPPSLSLLFTNEINLNLFFFSIECYTRR